MTKRKKEFKLERVSFRVDPRYLDEFESHCKKVGVKRSEAIRTIFNTHNNNLKQEKNENNIVQVPAN